MENSSRLLQDFPWKFLWHIDKLSRRKSTLISLPFFSLHWILTWIHFARRVSVIIKLYFLLFLSFDISTRVKEDFPHGVSFAILIIRMEFAVSHRTNFTHHRCSGLFLSFNHLQEKKRLNFLMSFYEKKHIKSKSFRESVRESEREKVRAKTWFSFLFCAQSTWKIGEKWKF